MATANMAKLTNNVNSNDKAKKEAVLNWQNCLKKVGENQDRKAFQDLFNHFAPLIKAFALKQAGGDRNGSFADELVQETMMKIWRKSASYDPEKASPSTWIFTIARNARIDLIRKMARHEMNTVSGSGQDEDSLDVDDIWVDDNQQDVFMKIQQERNAKNLHESLLNLPKEQALILQKVYLEDMSHTEVAHAMDLPLGTVKSRVRLALNKLRITVDR